MAKIASRSKFAVDLFYRVWDEARSCWIVNQGKSIWATKGGAERVRDLLINSEGRNPATLSVERVFVEVR